MIIALTYDLKFQNIYLLMLSLPSNYLAFAALSSSTLSNT